MIRSLCSPSRALLLLLCLLLSLLTPVFRDRIHDLRHWSNTPSSATPAPSAPSSAPPSPSREKRCFFLCLFLGFSFSLLLHARRYFWHWRKFGSRRRKAIGIFPLGKHLLLISCRIVRSDFYSMLLEILLLGLSSRIWPERCNGAKFVHIS